MSEDYIFQAYITNLGKYNEGYLIGEWVKFPTSYENLQKVFERIGINEHYEEWFITDYDCPVIPAMYDVFGEYESLDELNYLAGKIEEMSQSERENYEAAIDVGEYASSVKDLINLAENLDCYVLYSDIHNDSDLGYYWIEESGAYDTKVMGNLASYIDYEAFGRDIRLNESGDFTNYGYMINDSGAFNEIYNGNRDDIPDEYRVMSKTTEKAFEETPQKPSIRRQLAENKAKCADITVKQTIHKKHDLEV